MKTRLRWFWVALGAFLAVFGEEFLRKLLAVSLCGVFLLSYCLPEAKFSDSVVAQTPQPAILQSQTGQKIDDYFNPIQKDGQPKLGIDRWWATAGVDKEITVNWTVKIEKEGSYYINLKSLTLSGKRWQLSDLVTINIFNRENNTEKTIKLSRGFAENNPVGDLTQGIYTFKISNIIVPKIPVVEEVKFELGLTVPNPRGDFSTEKKPTNQINALFVADYPETNSQYLLKIQQADKKIFKTKIPVSKSQLINYFTPILNFEPEEEYQVPFDVNKNTWKAATKANIKDIGNADDYLDLSQFKTDIKGAYSRSKKTPAKIYASIVENDNIDDKTTGIKELAINYYFHYPYSNWYDHNGFNNHEGDWEGITVFLRKDRDGFYFPCRVAFGEHVFWVSELASKGGEIIEWARLVKDNNIVFSTNSDSRNDILAQPNVFVGLAGLFHFQEERKMVG